MTFGDETRIPAVNGVSYGWSAEQSLQGGGWAAPCMVTSSIWHRGSRISAKTLSRGFGTRWGLRLYHLGVEALTLRQAIAPP